MKMWIGWARPVRPRPHMAPVVLTPVQPRAEGQSRPRFHSHIGRFSSTPPPRPALQKGPKLALTRLRWGWMDRTTEMKPLS